MQSKRIVLGVSGLVLLASLGFLLPKRSHASGATPVAVVNKPTVTVGNTANVSVVNTPSVNVANSPSVAVSSMPPVQMSGSVNVANSALTPIFTTLALTPVQLSGSCTYPQGSSTCTQDDIYTVPTGSTLIITEYMGFCGVAVGGSSVDYGTLAAQLFVNGVGPTQTLTAPASTGGDEPFTMSIFGTNATFYATSGTSLSVEFLAGGIQNNGSNCGYTIVANLAPISSSSAIRK